MAQVVVSFVGNQDLMALNVLPRGPAWKADDMSPILRLVLHLSNNGLFQPGSRVLLFDDHPENNDRARFRACLEQELRNYRLDATVDLEPLAQARGPTDYDALFEHVWRLVPHGADMRRAEVCFHLTSGTPAMHATLMLAAMCLPLDSALMFETSKEKECLEVNPPYVLALRRRRERQVAPGPTILSTEARRDLLPNTVVDDEEAQRQFVVLHRAATSRNRVARLVISGPTGSGKTRAARQFARWAGRTLIEWTAHDLDRDAMPTVQDGVAIVLRRVDEASVAQLTRLREWVERSPKTAWLVTFRTDRRGPTGREALLSEGMPGSAEVLLPDLSVRTDIVEIAEAITKELGLWDTKVKERLQHEVFTAATPSGMHSLKSMLATAGIHSESRHIDARAFEVAHRTREAADAAALLLQIGEMLSGLRLGGSLKLEQVLEATKVAAARLALAGGRTQAQAAELLGCAQQSVSSWSQSGEVLEELRRHARYVDDA